MFIPVPETHGRSIAKAVSWRITGSIDTFALSWLITGNVVSAGSIASAEVITKSCCTISTNGHGRSFRLAGA